MIKLHTCAVHHELDLHSIVVTLEPTLLLLLL